MPNKDSFTFSDKLRKSKSVPLSKRLPSIVGGQNKQKRTLVQRAQRDLPFIMVAACALLLLPFLSKNGTDDINTPGEFGWDPTETNTGVINNRPEIMPPDALEDPTKWIIWNPKSDVKGSDVNPEKPNVDSIGNPNRNNPRTPRDWDDNVGVDNPTYGGTTGGRRNSTERNKTPVKENALGHKQTPPATVSSPAPRKSQTVDRKLKDIEGIDRKIAAKENKPSPTEKFGPQTKPHIRNSVVRKGTEINRQLRLSQMPKNGAGANVSHALPTGQAPVRTSSPSAPNPGIRPVALQPMDARGTVGRSMTGENLYAEAARSINAMNAGRGAKANLLAAQMRDVDGTLTPGAEGGTFGGDGSPRPGAGGGGPNNNNGYKVDKPWWWDMMQTRSQKWWELFQYKWREMLWTNIYDIIFNGGKQIVNCLLFGNKEVDVSHMFGAGASSPDYVCMKNGQEIEEVGSAKDFVGDFSNKTTSGTKDGNSEERSDTGSGWAQFEKLCEKYGGIPAKKDNSDDGFFAVRGKCLGLNILAKQVKRWFAAKEYKGDCDGVNGNPLKYTLSVTKNGKAKEGLENKAVIALVAHVKENAQVDKYKDEELVIYIQKGKSIEMSQDALKQMAGTNCEVTKLVSFVPRDGESSVDKTVGIANSPEQISEHTSYTGIEPTESGVGFSFDSYPTQGHVLAAKSVCAGTAPVEGVEPWSLDTLLNNLGNAKVDSLNTCKIYDENNRPGVGDKRIGTAKCYANNPRSVNMKERRYYSATITNPEPGAIKVYALLAEQIDGESNAKVIYMAEMDEHNRVCNDPERPNTCEYSFSTNAGGSKGFNPNQEGQTVRTDYNSNKSSKSSTDNADQRQKLENNTSAVNTTLNTAIAEQQRQCNALAQQLNGLSGKDLETKQAALADCQATLRSLGGGLTVGNYQGDSNSSSEGNDPGTARGSGRVYWILSRADNLSVKELADLGTTLHMLKATNLAEDIIASDYCEYYWCDDIAGCNPSVACDGYCKEDGKLYTSHVYTYDGNDIKIKLNESNVPADSLGDVEECTDVCYDSMTPLDNNDYNVYILTGGVQGNKIGTLNDIDLPIDVTPQCPLFCKDTEDNNVYPAALIKVGEENHFVRTSTTAVANMTEAPYCSYIAWITLNEQRNVFLLPAKWKAPGMPLPMVYDPEAHTTNIYEAQKELFDNLISKGPGLIDSYHWELIPELKSPEDAEEDVVNVVEKCTIQYQPTYLNNHIEPNDPNSVQILVEKINECFNALTNLGVRKTKLYFYGYASTKGDEPEKCATNGSEYTGCNKALSEDRNLYLMKEVTQHAEKRAQIGVDNIDQFADYNGFKNTPTPPGERFDRTKHRLVSGLSENEKVFDLISRPCGSLGANEDDPDNERYVFITLFDFRADACNRRIRESNIEELMSEALASYNVPLPPVLPLSFEPTTMASIVTNAQAPVVIKAEGDNEPDGDGEELDPELVQRAEELLAQINRSDQATLSNPVVCNKYIKQVNNLLGIAENDGVDLTRGNVAVLKSKMEKLSEKIHPTASKNNGATRNNNSSGIVHLNPAEGWNTGGNHVPTNKDGSLVNQ